MRYFPRRPHHPRISDELAADIVKDRDYIPRVYGASPAVVFPPLPPMASIKRILAPRRAQLAQHFKQVQPQWSEPQASTTKAKKVNAGWAKMQAIMNGARDHIHGYDDGEYEPQKRWEGYYVAS